MGFRLALAAGWIAVIIGGFAIAASAGVDLIGGL